MRQVKIALAALLAVTLLCGAPLRAGEVVTLFAADAEALPTCANARASKIEGAAGGTAVRFDSPAARIGASLKLEPGAYTVVFRVFAPSGEQDALYVMVGGSRARIAIGEFGRWVVRTHVFEVQKAAEHAVVLAPDPNELGLAIDQVALVRGAIGKIAQMNDLPKPAGKVALKKTATSHARDFEMAGLPDKPRGRRLDTLFYCSFDRSRDADYARGNGRCGLIAGGKLAEGKWGKALDCTDRKVNMYFNMCRNLVPRAGTLECWVKSGESNIWADGKDHCLFYLTPRARMPGRPRVPLSIELTKRGKDNALHLTVARGASADLAVPTAKLDPQAWHHLAFSWDFVGDAPRLWLCVDGRGREVTLPRRVAPLPFFCLQIGNTRWYEHYRHPDEFKPFGGLVDELHISDETLARREAGYKPLDIGELDVETALAAEDALRKWLDKWADLQLGGAWGAWITPMVDAGSEVTLDWTKQPADWRRVDNKYGSSGQLARHFLAAYEHTGDERWLRVALNTAEFFLRGQHARGYWHQSYVVDESGAVAPAHGTKWARVQDGYQSRRWEYLLYMHRVTGDRRYFESAKRCADFLLSIENPNGSWPGTYDASRGVGRTTGGRGVVHGCEYNDYATTDPMRMMIAMYHLTGNEKYVRGTHGKGIAGIGQWMFDTQLGKGKVRGWCQQYGRDNKPVWSRAFEAPVISPRVVCRFIHPMCLWLHLMTGEQRYMKLLEETYDWYRSIEAPGPNGGWYYQYLPDGSAVYSTGYKTITIDPKDPGAPKPSRAKLTLTALERTLKKYKDLGPEKFRQSFVRAVELTAADVAARRKSAASYCRSRAQAVRDEIKAQRSDGAWTRGHRLRLPNQAATFGYVLNLHLARGVVPPRLLRRGGEGPGFGMPILWVRDWFDVPLTPRK